MGWIKEWMEKSREQFNREEAAEEEDRTNHAWQQLYSGKDESTLPAVPTENELKRDARQQKMRADYFFKAAVRESSFNRRRNIRQQCEMGGNWYWEIIRKNGVPIRIKHPPFQSMRQFKREEAYRELAAEDRRRELATYRRQPKPKKPGGGARPDTVLLTPDGNFRDAVCECACGGGGLVIERTGQEISCHFCGATWTAKLETDPLVVELVSEAATNRFTILNFRQLTGKENHPQQ